MWGRLNEKLKAKTLVQPQGCEEEGRGRRRQQLHVVLSCIDPVRLPSASPAGPLPPSLPGSPCASVALLPLMWTSVGPGDHT